MRTSCPPSPRPQPRPSKGHADRLPLPAATGEAGLKYSAKHHLFRAALCHLCLDATDEATALSRYEQLYPQGGDSRECNLLRRLMDHIEAQDVDAFTDAVKEYDSISRLDQWQAALLL